ELGWKSVGVLELTALPSLPKERWVSWVREADVLLVNGGDTLYLAHWMRESGLADLLPSLRAVYRSEEHTSELQSRENLVCRLLLPPTSSSTLSLHDALSDLSWGGSPWACWN